MKNKLILLKKIYWWIDKRKLKSDSWLWSK